MIGRALIALSGHVLSSFSSQIRNRVVFVVVVVAAAAAEVEKLPSTIR